MKTKTCPSSKDLRFLDPLALALAQFEPLDFSTFGFWQFASVKTTERGYL